MIKDYKKVFGENLKFRRILMRYTISEFADLIGVPEQFVHDVEAGQKSFPFDIFVLAADLLNCSIDKLLSRHQNQTFEQAGSINSKRIMKFYNFREYHDTVSNQVNQLKAENNSLHEEITELNNKNLRLEKAENENFSLIKDLQEKNRALSNEIQLLEQGKIETLSKLEELKIKLKDNTAASL